MNRFTKDMNSIDELLPMAFYDTSVIAFSLTATLIVVSTRNYYVALPAVVVVFVSWKLREFFVKTARDLKRLESICKYNKFIMRLNYVSFTHFEALVSSKIPRILSPYGFGTGTNYYKGFASSRTTRGPI